MQIDTGKEGLMSALVTNDATEHYLRECLKSAGYDLSAHKANGQTGVDILASRDEETIHIKVIGFC